jgi:predicted lipid-binding transport protein (Tim44 family)
MDTTGKFSHGDLQFIGNVSKHWMQIQLSFNSIKERDKLKELVLKSEFE